MGYRVIRKIERIVREEMNTAGAEEVLMSALINSELFRESGRWEIFGEEMFRLKDRNNRDFCLGPTHEEVFMQTVKSTLHSYKSLPVTLYQIQMKFRHERRPRFGVIRSREFIMKDAYSFGNLYNKLPTQIIHRDTNKLHGAATIDIILYNRGIA